MLSSATCRFQSGNLKIMGAFTPLRGVNHALRGFGPGRPGGGR